MPVRRNAMEKNQVWWLWRGISRGAEGGWELSYQSFSEKVTFEQTPKRKNGISHENFRQRKTMKAEGRANGRALRKERA